VRVLSVDVGTSNTVAVLSAHGRPPRVVEVDGSATMPSAVFAGEDGQLTVGREAERRARVDPTRFEPNPKRRIDEQTLLLGDKIVPVNEALAAVLRRVLEETSRQLGEPLDQVRLTHPAEWGPLRQNVLLSAARLAGMAGDVSLIPEPVAAAAHFASFPGRALPIGQALAVYDLGAGTFDVAVVGATQTGFTVLAEDGFPDLGGLDIDQALLVHIGREVSHRDPQQWQRLLRPESTQDRRTRRALQEDVRAAKEALSSHPQTEVPMPEPFTDVLVTRTELEALVRPALLRSVELLAKTVQGAGLAPQRLAGIYLVGGSSRLPLVATMLSEKLGVVPTSLDQPETAVALGAHHVSGDGLTMRTQDVAHHIASTGTGSYPVSEEPTVITGPVASRPVMGHRASPAVAGYPNSFPPSGPQHVAPSPTSASSPTSGPLRFPHQPVSPMSGNKVSPRRRGLLIGVLAVVVLLVAGGVLWISQTGSSANTFTAAECQKPGALDDKGFTGCLRQLAGKIADTAQCASGTGNGQISPPTTEGFGVAATCSAPALAGAQVTYIQGSSAASLENYAQQLLASIGGDRIEAQWQGNGLEGRYSSVASANASLLIFTVSDRPLLGVIYQVNNSNQPVASSASAMADYFEKTIQPGQ
jgi:actin-like ATPase involved in cell morphogenesis